MLFNSLSQLKKLSYRKVNNISLPAKPENNPQFVYTGRKLLSRPLLLEEYIRGGWRFSEYRKREIQSMYNRRPSYNIIAENRKLKEDRLIYTIFGKELMV